MLPPQKCLCPDTQNGDRLITGSAAGGGTYKITKLENTETTGIPATRTDISGGSATLDISLGCLGTAFLASGATFIMARDTGMLSITAEDSGIMSMMTGDSCMPAILQRGSSVAAML